VRTGKLYWLWSNHMNLKCRQADCEKVALKIKMLQNRETTTTTRKKCFTIEKCMAGKDVV